MSIKEFEESGLKTLFDGFFDRVYFDMAGTGGWTTEPRHALSVIKPERLAFASDYPHDLNQLADYRAYLDCIKALDIPEGDKTNILGGNMKTLFNL